MSWLELDDRILEHPKFIRAVNFAGSSVVHLWLGLRAYVAQNLTDGFVPDDMLSEVRGPRDAERSTAIETLRAVKLAHNLEERLACKRCRCARAKGVPGIWMHDYLEWSSSRDQVETRRKSARERKARSREPSHSESRRDEQETPSGVTNPRGRGSSAPPLPSKPSQEEPSDRRARLDAAQQFKVEIGEIFEAWRQSTGHPNAKLDPKRRARIAARLREGFTVMQLVDAIKHRVNDPFLMGSSGRVYDGLETLLRDAAQVERLVALTMPIRPAPAAHAAQSEVDAKAARRVLLDDAKAGRYGVEKARWARSGQRLGELVVELQKSKRVPVESLGEVLEQLRQEAS